MGKVHENELCVVCTVSRTGHESRQEFLSASSKLANILQSTQTCSALENSLLRNRLKDIQCKKLSENTRWDKSRSIALTI